MGDIVSYNEEEKKKLAALARMIASDIVQGRGLTVFFDNDGTLFPFRKDPKDVAVDPECYRAMVRLSRLAGVRAVSLTGRDVEEARDLMLTPGLAVCDSFGAEIAPDGEKRLYFQIIGSHGVESLAPDASDGARGGVTRYEFSTEESAFIERFQSFARDFKTKHPALTVEIKHGAVGVNVSTLPDGQDSPEIYREILAGLEGIVNDPGAPQTPDGRRIFDIRKEGEREVEVRPSVYGKDFGILTFGGKIDGGRTLFLCDSLGAEGTDAPAATLVNGLENGEVLMVRNGRNAPPPADSPARPFFVFANPAMLGRFLGFVATQAEQDLAHRLAQIPSAPAV